MAKLVDTNVAGSFLLDNLLIAGAGAGFQNMVIFTTTGAGQTFTFPTILQVPGAKFKITVVGAGGQGGSNVSGTASSMGSGGGSGGVVIAIITVVSGLYSLTYTVGAGGAGTGTQTAGTAATSGGLSSVVYNSITYSAGGGVGGICSGSAGYSGGAGGAATGGTINLPGARGGSGGTMSATRKDIGFGGNTPRGFGIGGGHFNHTISNPRQGMAGVGYGAGGSGTWQLGSTGNNRGGSGANGLVIIEY